MDDDMFQIQQHTLYADEIKSVTIGYLLFIIIIMSDLIAYG